MEASNSTLKYVMSKHNGNIPPRRVEGFGPVAFPVPLSLGGSCVGDMPPEFRLEALKANLPFIGLTL